MKNRARNRIKGVLQLLVCNWRVLLGFELVYKFLTKAAITPLFWAVFNGIMKLTGYPYLTYENVTHFLRNPLVIVLLLVLLGAIAVYSVADIGAVVFILDQSYQKNQVNLFQVIQFSIKNAARTFRRKNCRIAGLILCLLPFLNVGVASGFFGTIAFPQFLTSFIERNHTLLLVLGAGMVVLAVFLQRWIYVFHYYTLEECDFSEAGKRSSALGKGRRCRDLLVLVLIQVCSYLLYFVLAGVGILLIIVLERAFGRMELFRVVSTTLIWGLLVCAMALASALSTPFGYACISVMYYLHKEDRGEEVKHREVVPYVLKDKTKAQIRRMELLLLLAGIGIGGFQFGRMAQEKADMQVEYLKTMDVTAHRGYSAKYPENTMAAFEGAVEAGADWIELDIHQSRDGQIFVMHDRNFRRTTGVNKNAWELDFDEIAQLDAGSYFSKTYAGEKIPLLSEVLEFAKEKEICLNIELKPTGHETEFEKGVVDLIRESEMVEQCVVTSQEYRVLEKIKSLDEDIRTVYVMGLAYGNVDRLEDADAFSIEASSVTKRMVSRVHNAGKQIFVWTVNTESGIRRMLDLKVDNIITNRVILAKNCIYESKTSSVIQEYVKFLRNQ